MLVITPFIDEPILRDDEELTANLLEKLVIEEFK